MKYAIILLALIGIVCMGCEENNILSPSERISQIEMDLTGLQAPGDSAWYEAWIVWLNRGAAGDTEEHESIGFLEFDQSGNFMKKTYDVDMGYLQAGLTVMVTIEEDNVPGYRVRMVTTGDSTYMDSTAGPSRYRIIAADIVANAGEFRLGNPRILDWSLESSEAHFFLDTPTDSVGGSPLSGIWLARLDTTLVDDTETVSIESGLGLPDLANGWTYEALITIGGAEYSLGSFTSPAGADDSNMYSGTDPGYPFPGEDFIYDAQGNDWRADLSGSELSVVLRAPYPSQANYPFSEDLVLFSAALPSNPQHMRNYSLTNHADMLPGGSIELLISVFE